MKYTKAVVLIARGVLRSAREAARQLGEGLGRHRLAATVKLLQSGQLLVPEDAVRQAREEPGRDLSSTHLRTRGRPPTLSSEA